MEKKLQRNSQEGAIAGICAGLGEYLGIDKTWVRLFFIATIFFSFMGVGLMGPVVYIILWIVLPEKPMIFPVAPFSVNYKMNPSLGDEPPAQPFPVHPLPPKKSNDRQVAGIILLLIGIVFLMRQFEFIWWHDVVKLWPVAIILLGVFIVVRAFNGEAGKGQVFQKGNEDPGAANADQEKTYTK